LKTVSERKVPSPNAIYGFHKFVSEELIKAYSVSYGIDFTILRLFNVYGQDPQVGKDVISIFLRQAKKGEQLIVKGKNKYRDFIHVNDTVKAFAGSLSAQTSSRVINVGTGEKMALGELVEILKEVFPKIKVKYQHAADDGTGLIANNELCRKLLHLTPTGPRNGIKEHIRRYAK